MASKLGYFLLAFTAYFFAPFLPHFLTIVKYVCTGQFSRLEDAIRYDLYWDIAKDAEKHVFPHLTPTPLSAPQAREIFLREYEAFRQKQEIPSFLDIDPSHQADTDPNSSWKTLFLRVYGVETCISKQFPETIKTIDASGIGALTIMFTRMYPGQVIEKHTGPTKIVLRYLMGLKVPKQMGAHLKVWECKDGECPETRLNWTKDGDEYIFDDSFYHYSANPTEEERVALWLDLERPDMKGWRERMYNHIILTVIRLFPFDRKKGIVDRTNKICSNADAAAAAEGMSATQ